MDLKGKRVLVRIDGNVPIVKGKAVDGKHGKIARAAVGLEWLSQRGAKAIILTHLGRPGGKRLAAYSLEPVARRLSELLGRKVSYIKALEGPRVVKHIERMDNGEVLLLDNIRFDPREEQNSPSFAQALAQLADLYVNDAFSVSHRAHTSVDAITDELPSYAGPLVMNEVSVMNKVIRNPKKPVVLAMGGLKVKGKLPVMQKFLPNVDAVLVGGALANAFLKAQGYEVGKSAYDEEGVPIAKKLLKRWKNKLLLPVDVRVASSLRSSAKIKTVSIEAVGKNDRIIDVGNRSMRAYARKIQEAKTIIWNGPFGYCEVKAFSHGTALLATNIAARTGKALTVVGGGDTEPLVEALGLSDRFSLLSTGGGAMLEFLAGKKLPGLTALQP
jgi:3-phosphoglycerate kinase